MEDTALHLFLNTAGIKCYLYPGTPFTFSLINSASFFISSIPLSFVLKSEKVSQFVKAKCGEFACICAYKITVSTKESLLFQPSGFKTKHLKRQQVTTRGRRIWLPVDVCLKLDAERSERIPLTDNCKYEHTESAKGIYGLPYILSYVLHPGNGSVSLITS